MWFDGKTSAALKGRAYSVCVEEGQGLISCLHFIYFFSLISSLVATLTSYLLWEHYGIVIGALSLALCWTGSFSVEGISNPPVGIDLV